MLRVIPRPSEAGPADHEVDNAIEILAKLLPLSERLAHHTSCRSVVERHDSAGDEFAYPESIEFRQKCHGRFAHKCLRSRIQNRLGHIRMRRVRGGEPFELGHAPRSAFWMLGQPLRVTDDEHCDPCGADRTWRYARSLGVWLWNPASDLLELLPECLGIGLLFSIENPSAAVRERDGKRRLLCCFDPLFCALSQMFRPLEIELNSVAKILNGVIADIKTRRQKLQRLVRIACKLLKPLFSPAGHKVTRRAVREEELDTHVAEACFSMREGMPFDYLLIHFLTGLRPTRNHPDPPCFVLRSEVLLPREKDPVPEEDLE